MSQDFQYANTVRGIVQRITYQLNDAETGWENQTWSEAWITARVLDTFKWFQDDDPSLFAQEQTIQLTSGSKQDLPDSCENLIDFDCAFTPEGLEVPIFMIDYKDLKASTVYNKLMPKCFSDSCVYSAAINPLNSRTFLIDPPVPTGKTLSLRINCSDVSTFFDDVDKEINCDIAKYFNAVIEWVMFEALSMDSLNPTTLAIANVHRENFFGLVPQLQNFFDRGLRNDAN